MYGIKTDDISGFAALIFIEVIKCNRNLSKSQMRNLLTDIVSVALYGLGGSVLNPKSEKSIFKIDKAKCKLLHCKP